jgi:hypothetical protein
MNPSLDRRCDRARRKAPGRQLHQRRAGPKSHFPIAGEPREIRNNNRVDGSGLEMIEKCSVFRTICVEARGPLASVINLINDKAVCLGVLLDCRDAMLAVRSVEEQAVDRQTAE